ncbi:unnamed protein product, partial [marine sediment metagenome]
TNAGHQLWSVIPSIGYDTVGSTIYPEAVSCVFIGISSKDVIVFAFIGDLKVSLPTSSGIKIP